MPTFNDFTGRIYQWLGLVSRQTDTHPTVPLAAGGVDLADGTAALLVVQTTAGGTVAAMDSTGTEYASDGGSATHTVASGAANTVIKASAGRLCRVLITTVGAGTGNVLIYDNATTNTGTVIGAFPATSSAAVGNVYTFEMPAANGITVANVASGPAFTVSYF